MYKRFRKKKIILPLLVFLSGMSILGMTTYRLIKFQMNNDLTHSLMHDMSQSYRAYKAIST